MSSDYTHTRDPPAPPYATPVQVRLVPARDASAARARTPHRSRHACSYGYVTVAAMRLWSQSHAKYAPTRQVTHVAWRSWSG
eukprot:3599039-Rhodomonas_salina.2